MKAMQLILCLLVICISISATERAKAKWTYMLYLTSAPDTEDDKVRNILELAEYGSTSNLNIIVQVDWVKSGSQICSDKKYYFPDPQYTGTSRYFIRQDSVNLVSQLGEVNMGDVNELYSFMEYCRTTYPAERYLLLFGGHGSGFESYNDLGLPLRDELYPKAQLVDRYPLPEVVESLQPARSIAYDDLEADCITLQELKAALSRFKQKEGKKVDFLVYDSCLLMSLETLHEMRDSAIVSIGSEAGVLIAGMTYDPMVKPIYQDANVDLMKLLSEISYGFVGGGSWSATWTNMWDGAVASAFVHNTKDLLVNFNRFCELLLKVDRQSLTFKNLMAFGKEERYLDLDVICQSVINGNVGFKSNAYYGEISAAAKKILENTKGIRAAHWTVGKYNYKGLGGLSVWWPLRERYEQFRDQLKALDIARDSLWDEFMDYYTFGTVKHTIREKTAALRSVNQQLGIAATAGGDQLESMLEQRSRLIDEIGCLLPLAETGVKDELRSDLSTPGFEELKNYLD
ncbi:MAG: clostripain-related cysteine peptidase [Candidatus Wallbacteria bacterium]|nr:clostripain-related cysteine peptidase [Candidatus Wallbacteria bacterium]